MLKGFITISILFCLAVFMLVGCAAKGNTETNSSASATNSANPAANANTSERSIAIEIKPNSPADTVRAFYKLLKENKIRDAIFLTNLRPAVEGLSDIELQEFKADFDVIARSIPTDVVINGEVISEDKATVTVKLPGDDPETDELQELNLRKTDGVWIIQTVDEAAEESVKKQGKNYLYLLRIETKQDEARSMLERVAKAQLAYSAQNGGLYGDLNELIKTELLPDDILDSKTTGYRYAMDLTPDKKSYSATAIPEVYGKTGRLSFRVKFGDDGKPTLSSTDNGGKLPDK